jgi:hypothetical protein
MPDRFQRRSGIAIAALLFLLLSASSPVLADETSAEETPEDKKNTLALLLGGTFEARRENGFTVGLEYERRLNATVGVGIAGEHVFGDLDFTIVVLPVFFHTGSWKFLVGPGIEDGDTSSEFMVRFGGAYEFDVSGWIIAPGMDFDLVAGDVVPVIGVAIGKEF